jgi:hypothetical protein
MNQLGDTKLLLPGSLKWEAGQLGQEVRASWQGWDRVSERHNDVPTPESQEGQDAL